VSHHPTSTAGADTGGSHPDTVGNHTSIIFMALFGEVTTEWQNDPEGAANDANR
jgi:hypothetical protein